MTTTNSAPAPAESPGPEYPLVEGDKLLLTEEQVRDVRFFRRMLKRAADEGLTVTQV